jgi:hypothetical protein
MSCERKQYSSEARWIGGCLGLGSELGINGNWTRGNFLDDVSALIWVEAGVCIQLNTIAKTQQVLKLGWIDLLGGKASGKESELHWLCFSFPAPPPHF